MQNYNRPKYKHLLPEPNLEFHSLTALIDLAYDHLSYILDDTLQNQLFWYNWHIKQANPKHQLISEIRNRCEMLQDAISHLMALIASVQKYQFEIIKMEKAKNIAKDWWGNLPAKYTIALVYDKDKFYVILEKP